MAEAARQDSTGTKAVTPAPAPQHLPRERHHTGEAQLAASFSGNPTFSFRRAQRLHFGPLVTLTDTAASGSGHTVCSEPSSVPRGSPTHGTIPGMSTLLKQSAQSPTGGQTTSAVGAVGSGGGGSSYALSSRRRVLNRTLRTGSLRTCTACSEPSARLATIGHPGRVLGPPALRQLWVPEPPGGSDHNIGGSRSQSSSFNTFGAFSGLPFESSTPEAQPRLESSSNTGL